MARLRHHGLTRIFNLCGTPELYTRSTIGVRLPEVLASGLGIITTV
jgi:hypothetical protein